MYYISLTFNTNLMFSPCPQNKEEREAEGRKPSRSKIPHVRVNVGQDGKRWLDGDTQSRGHDFSKPIPWTTLANALLVMMGDYPIPTKREYPTNVFHRDEVVDAISREAYIDFDQPFRFIDTEKGPFIRTVMTTSKSKWDSHASVYTAFDYFQPNGSVKTIKQEGSYSWRIFRRFCSPCPEMWDLTQNFLKQFLEYNPTDKPFKDVVSDLSRHYYEPGFEEKRDKFMSDAEEIGVRGALPWFKALFCLKKTAINTRTRTSENGNLYELNLVRSGICKSTYISGRIICQTEDVDLVQRLLVGKRFCFIPEEGIIRLDRIDKIEPVPDYQDKYLRIFEYKNASEEMIAS